MSCTKALWQEAAGVTVGGTPEGNEEEEKGTHEVKTKADSISLPFETHCTRR